MVVDSNAGFNVNDLLLVTSNDGSHRCTHHAVHGRTRPRWAATGPWRMRPRRSYNPATPTAVFTNAASYQLRDTVVNLGTFGQRRFQVVCNDAATPARRTPAT